jgi:hypothetical protein
MQEQDKQFMPDATPEERLHRMRDNFDTIKETYTKILTETELTETRKVLDDLVNEIDMKEDDLKSYVKPRKDEIKQKKSERKKLSEITRYGQQDITSELFIMKDYHQKMAYLRDDLGILVKVRPLTSDELQGGLF